MQTYAFCSPQVNNYRPDQTDDSYGTSTAKHRPNYPPLHQAAVVFGCKQCNQGGSNVEHIRGSSLTDSQVSLNLSVMDINEERGRQKMELSRGGGDL